MKKLTVILSGFILLSLLFITFIVTTLFTLKDIILSPIAIIELTNKTLENENKELKPMTEEDFAKFQIISAFDYHNELLDNNPINWKKPSEPINYPDLSDFPNLKIEVHLKKQRMYIMDADIPFYGMNISSGMFTKETATPIGSFKIEAERGETFFNPEENMGANNWISFKDHGIFLFHSVPIDKEGNYIESEALKLGEPASHGCIRLSIPDSEYLYDNLPEATPVLILDE